MPTLFTRIIDGELPGHFVWRDPECVAFLSINPLRDGHVLVVPRVEVDHWLDLDGVALAHLGAVAQTIGRALMAEYRPAKVGSMLVGLEVPHVHVHLVPIDGLHDMDFGNAAASVPAGTLAHHAERIRARLAEQGHGERAVA